MTDGALVTRFLKGDIQAFNTLVWRWEKPLLNFIWRQVGDEETARDLTQTALIRIYRQLSKLKEPERFSSWAYRIALNLCHDEFKRRKRHRQVSLDDIAPSSLLLREHIESPPTPETVLHQSQLSEMLQASLQRIPEEQRVVVVMKQYQGLKFTEIADILKEPVNTVKSRLYYGLKALKKQLEASELGKEGLLHEMP